MIQLVPQPLRVLRIFADQQGRVTGINTICDQPICGQMRMSPGVAVTAEARVCMNHYTRDAPMRQIVRAVCDLIAGYWHMQNEGFNARDLH